jgi:hypothetical protein
VSQVRAFTHMELVRAIPASRLVRCLPVQIGGLMTTGFDESKVLVVDDEPSVANALRARALD